MKSSSLRSFSGLSFPVSKKMLCLLAVAVVAAGVFLFAGRSFAAEQQISFTPSGLQGVDLTNPTSLQFGPDGRLYVSQQDGTIKAYAIDRTASSTYNVTATETINEIKAIPNHNDDGSTAGAPTSKRQVTGILVTGSAANPVIYVTSSDPRIEVSNTNPPESSLDTNSGIISKLTWNGSGWQKVDLVRGLPRSEENHSQNGLQIDEQNNVLYVASGGNTNMGAPSDKFSYLPEYALSTAILSVDLDEIGNSTYDLPTLDPSLSKATDGPFGGMDGANQAKLVEGEPVQVYSPGYRNIYDLVISGSGKMYTFDNGPNGGWGGPPVGEGPGGNCTNQPNEEGDDKSLPDNLHYVTGKGYYAGHPNPTRASTSNTFGGKSPVSAGNAVECDYLLPGQEDGALTTIPSSTNGMAEYTASNFGGAMEGDLLAAAFNGNIYRLKLNAAGDSLASKEAIFSGFGSTPLDVTAQGDNGPFPGTVWAATYGSDDITVFEPADYDGGGGGGDCTGADDPSLDEDGDGYKNDDEIDNNTDPCSAASVPPDYDGDKVSNKNDPDDDNDTQPDTSDKFAVDPDNGMTTELPTELSFAPGSYENTLLDLGFTGLMTNGKDNYQSLYDESNITAGGAAQVLTISNVPPGDAVNNKNSQQYAFQFGAKPTSKPFVAHTRVLAPFPDGVTPQNHQSAGFFIGTGDQDNYAKLVVSAKSGNGGIQFAKEVGGTFQSIKHPTVSGVKGDGKQVDLFLKVDPAAGMVEASYSINGSQPVVVGSTDIPASWLDGQQALAFGLISTSFQATETFAATWDFLNVVPENQPDPSGAKALVQMNANNTNINASTYAAGSFEITNNSTAENIESVTIDLGTAMLPDMVFDPDGTAGDQLAKGFTVDSLGGTGQSGHALLKEHNGKDGSDGYDALEVTFNDFDPGETFTFSIDIDPNSIKGTTAPGPNEAGSVSGMELSGSDITAAFSDGAILTANAFGDGSKGGSRAVVRSNPPEKPGIGVSGISSTPATVSEANQTVTVSGPQGAKVRLMQVEAGLFVPQGGGYNVQEYDANSAVVLEEKTATIGTGGTVDIPVTLTRQTDPEAGLNHLVAVIEDASGDAGPTSKTIVLNYDPDSNTSSELSASPASVDFGQVETGTSVEKTVTLTNDSSANLEISGTSGTENTEFSAELVQSAPVTLGPGETVGLKAGFAPTSDGQKTATVAVEHNGSDNPLNISLSGEGEAISLPSEPAALVAINSGTGINSSTYNAGSFKIANTSQAGEIDSVVFDLGTAILPDMVFDPLGKAGDKLGKCFKADSGGDVVGLVTDGSGQGDGSCVAPFSSPHDGGYDALEIKFNDFDPGETFTFSTDVDPTSIKGGPTIGGPGSVSGLELAGTTATVGFGGDVSHKTETYRLPSSKGGSQNTAKDGESAKPTLGVPGVTLEQTTLSNEHTAATVTEPEQTVQISGPAGAKVSLLVVEGELGVDNVPDGGFDIEEYEANNAVKITETTGKKIGADGTVDVPVTLTRSAENAGLNYIVAVIKDADGHSGPVSDVAILKLVDEAPANQAPVASDDSYEVDAGVKLEVNTADGVLANDTDADGDVLTAKLVDDVQNGSLALSQDGSFTYEPSAGFTGSDSFTYKASDGTGESNLATTTINVKPAANKAPTIETIGEQSAVEGQAFSLEVQASDPDDDTLNYSAQGLPAGLSIEKNTGNISGTPESGTATGSPYAVKASVSDGTDSATESFELEVAEPAPAPEGKLSSSAKSLGFGKVEVGKSSSKKVKLTNTGDAKLTIQRARIGGDAAAAFSHNFSGPVTLGKGKSKIIQITFKPQEVGAKKAKLIIRHDGTNGPVGVALSGRGVVAPDSAEPVISRPRPKPGAKIRNRKPLITAIVKDRESELKPGNIKLFVDGKRVKFQYDPETDRLQHKSKKLSFGKHTVKIVAIDAAKNKEVKTWRFKVVKRS